MTRPPPSEPREKSWPAIFRRSWSDDELSALVAAAIAETGASGMQGMGQVMKTLTPRIAGRADGARVAAEVRRRCPPAESGLSG